MRATAPRAHAFMAALLLAAVTSRLAIRQRQPPLSRLFGAAHIAAPPNTADGVAVNFTKHPSAGDGGQGDYDDNGEDGGEAPHVHVWFPAGLCTGSFASAPAVHGRTSFPYAVLRDASPDLRPSAERVSSAGSAASPPSAVRLLLVFAMHLSVTPEAAPEVTLTLPPPMARGAVRVASATWLRSEPPGFGFNLSAYAPGDTRLIGTRPGPDTTDWQLLVTLVPRSSQPTGFLPRLVHALPGSGALAPVIRMRMRLRRFDGADISFAPWFTIACATGWHAPQAAPRVPRLTAAPACGGGGARGALLVAGGALRGTKRDSSAGRQEVVHFAARALTGPTRFALVAIPVLVGRSVAEMTARCVAAGDAHGCVAHMAEHEREYLAVLRDDVELGLRALGVPRKLFARIVLLPLCRLGADWTASEAGSPCRQSATDGQLLANTLPYALLGAYYNWAASYDLDEFIAEMPADGDVHREQATAVAFAEDKLAALDASHDRRPGCFALPWLAFRAAAPVQDMLTAALRRGATPALLNAFPSGGPTAAAGECGQFERWHNGKPVLRCDVGLHFTPHMGVVLWRTGVARACRSYVATSGLRTWHARLERAGAPCVFEPAVHAAGDLHDEHDKAAVR